MMEKTRSEWEKEIQQHMCCLCECHPAAHIIYWPCLIFQGETICQQCCQIDVLRNDIAELFSKRLGRPITLEEINKICKKCGKNYAVQNEQLADDLENPEKNNEVKNHGKEEK